MRIDLHVHTRERSPCAHSSAEQMIRAAVDSGLDALVISDHDRLVPPGRLSTLNAKYAPFRIFGGVEVTLAGEHVLVLGVQQDLLERRWWTYPDLCAFVEGQGGFLALAHPFRFNGRVDVDVQCFPPHALELHSHNTPGRAGPVSGHWRQRSGCRCSQIPTPTTLAIWAPTTTGWMRTPGT